MNRVQFVIKAKNQYGIQSPFLYELYSEVIAPRLGRSLLARLGIDGNDRFGQLVYKLRDHYRAVDVEGGAVFPHDVAWLLLPDGSHTTLVNRPHCSADAERWWSRLLDSQGRTLAVDLFDVGILFDSKKLSRQTILLSPF